MRTLIKSVPIPAAGVALGLAALGNLLQPHAEAAHIVCGVLSLCFVALLVAETVLACAMVLFVTVHYARFFVRSVKTPDDVAVKREGKLAALIARGLQH